MGKKILVPVDGSRPSKHAMRYAASISKKLGLGILALRVIDVPRYSHWMATHQKMESEMEEEAQTILETARGIAGDYGVSIETAIRKGYPFEEIVNVVKEDPDVVLVAMGSSGKNLTARRMLGSVTQEVVREVSRSLPVPVVIVPGVDEMLHDRLGI